MTWRGAGAAPAVDRRHRHRRGGAGAAGCRRSSCSRSCTGAIAVDFRRAPGPKVLSGRARAAATCCRSVWPNRVALASAHDWAARSCTSASLPDCTRRTCAGACTCRRSSSTPSRRSRAATSQLGPAVVRVVGPWGLGWRQTTVDGLRARSGSIRTSRQSTCTRRSHGAGSSPSWGCAPCDCAPRAASSSASARRFPTIPCAPSTGAPPRAPAV